MEGIQIVLSVYLLLRAGGVVLKGKVKDSYTLFYVIIGVLIANYCNIGLISLVLLLCCWIYVLLYYLYSGIRKKKIKGIILILCIIMILSCFFFL